MKKFIALAVLAFLIFGSSCTSQKKLVYMQGIDTLALRAERIAQDYTIKIQKDDLLSIKVGTKDKELLEPFGNNLLLGQTGPSSTSNASAQKMNYYQVDSDGYLNLPVFGKILVEGESCVGLEEKLSREVKNRGLSYDPAVSVKLMNFKISVLGDVKNPGAVSVEGDRITILEALAKVGDLQASGLRGNVLVLREENGIRTTGRIDLTSIDLLSSPYYYLKQNDIVYIESNNSLSVKATPFFTFWSSGAGSIVSILVSVVSLISVLSK